MLDLADVTLLLLVALTASIYYFVYTAPRLRRHAAEAKKYRLFAIRDRLVLLVAEDKLREDSPAFQKFYKMANFLVNRTDGLTLSAFIYALQQAEAKGLSPLPEDNRILEEVQRNRELAEIVESFYRAVTAIILENSLLLRVVLKCKKFLPKKGGPTHLPPVQRQAYEMYRDYSRASNRISAAA